MNMNFGSYQPMYYSQMANQQMPQQPYMDRLTQLQQMQVPQQNISNMQMPMLGGKIVDSLEAVKATDIPIDGNMYYFPKADGSEVYSKRWLPNGTTQILTYKAVLDNDMSNSVATDIKNATNFNIELLDTINSKFDILSEKIEKLEKSIKPVTNTKAKKEVENE